MAIMFYSIVKKRGFWQKECKRASAWAGEAGADASVTQWRVSVFEGEGDGIVVGDVAYTVFVGGNHFKFFGRKKSGTFFEMPLCRGYTEAFTVLRICVRRR